MSQTTTAQIETHKSVQNRIILHYQNITSTQCANNALHVHSVLIMKDYLKLCGQ